MTGSPRCGEDSLHIWSESQHWRDMGFTTQPRWNPAPAFPIQFAKDLQIKTQAFPLLKLGKEDHFTAGDSLTTENLLWVLQQGQHLKLPCSNRCQRPRASSGKNDPIRVEPRQAEPMELCYFPPQLCIKAENDAALSPAHGSCRGDTWEAKWEQASGLCSERAVEPAELTAVSTHGREQHCWPGLTHELPRQRLRHSRRFLWLTRPVLQQPLSVYQRNSRQNI